MTQMHRNFIHRLITVVFVVILFATRAYSLGNTRISLRSSAFANGATIPLVYTCVGENKSPPLKWSGVPAGAKALAVVVRDPDAPSGSFVHWVLYNVPAGVSELPAGVAKTESIAQGTDQGVNGRGQIGYAGPCPPPGAPHHYHFRLYALDNRVGLKAGASADDVEGAIKGHVLGSAELVGTFGR
jgi:Raf kinase inhibitor-like YbhB/YbcL family protein